MTAGGVDAGISAWLEANLGRVIAWPQEIGVGIITGIVGAPVLVWLVRARKVGRL